MGEPDGETKFCSNCKRDIAASNYLMHNMHCHRNISLCKKCKEPIPRSELDQHLEEQHSQVPCTKCAKIMEYCELEEHNKFKCPKRIVQCCYCELECTLDEMKEHESYCGSRTEVCTLCGQYVMIRNKEQHELRSCVKLLPQQQVVHSGNLDSKGLNNRNIKQKSSRSTEKVGNNERPKVTRNIGDRVKQNNSMKRTNNLPQVNTSPQIEKVKCPQKSDLSEQINSVSYKFDHCTDFDEQLALNLLEEDLQNIQSDFEASYIQSDSIDPYDIIPGQPYPGSTFPMLLGHRPIIPGESSDEFIIPVVDPINYSPLSQTSQNVSDDVALPCEFCGDLYPEEILIQHQSGCKPEMAHRSRENTDNIDYSPIQSNDKKQTMIQQNVSDDHLPCEFCDELYPREFLIEHQSGCRPDIVHGPLETENNEIWQEELLDQNEANTVQNLPEDHIPCEFCNELFPTEHVIDHQAVCDANLLEPILSDELYPSINKNNLETASIHHHHHPKHQEDPTLETITSIIRSKDLEKSKEDTDKHNLKSLQEIKLKKSPSKEFINESSSHDRTYTRVLYRPKEQNKEYTNVDSYFDRIDRNHRPCKNRLYKDNSLDEIMRHVSDNSLYQGNSRRSTRSSCNEKCRTSPTGARPKNMYGEPENTVQPDNVWFRDLYGVDSERNERIRSRLAASLPPPLPLINTRPRREVKMNEMPTKHCTLQPLSLNGENFDSNSKSKNGKRKESDSY